MTDDLQERLKRWRIESPSANLSARIVGRSIQHRQITPWTVRLSRAFDEALSDWTYGLIYKMASIILIAATGLILGIIMPQADLESIDIVSLAMGIEQMEES